MNRSAAASEARSQVFFMLISAGLMAYFGFASSWAHQYTNSSAPQPNTLLPMVVLLKWTLRGGAIACGAAAVLSMMGLTLGPLLYSVTGLITAVLFVVVGVWEMTNPNGYFSGVPYILLFIFAAWNGYGSWMGLADILARRGTPPGAGASGTAVSESGR
jgi:hypothetical protein